MHGALDVTVAASPALSSLIPILARARYEAADLDRVASGVLSPLAGFLIRRESVACSRIEHVEASPVAFARAIGGHEENTSAISMVAADAAITEVVEAVTERVRSTACAAMEVLDEFEDLDRRIRERITRLRAD